MVPPVELDALAPWAALIAALVFFLLLDLHFFARGREPSFKEAAWWSVGWLALSLAAAIPVLILEGGNDAVTYTTVYLIERSLSLDNVATISSRNDRLPDRPISTKSG